MRRADLVETVGGAVEHARSPRERLDPVTLSVTALVVALLRTEVSVKRDPRGGWSLSVHKRALRDSVLGRVLTALPSHLNGDK
ncbi:hypothetical protein ACH4PU_34655 [Streptomyces sp. NPDC021100]|uniref:hypothetical protein n=1 Tax=Streptomyces sp. NPDC021100 TaxID=3365114 RepID=UPI0037A30529